MDKFQDITINDASLKALFISYFLNGQYGQAFDLITNNTQLNTKAFVANVMNEIAGILSSLQENFNDEVILYLENQLSGFQIIIDNYLLKNDYDGSTEYQIYNFVIYNDLIYMYINSDPSTGNLPTDTDYWVEIGLLGQKGEPGIGVNLRYTWDSLVTYNALDVVYYNNKLWVATIQNTNVTPGTETTWQTLTGSIVTVDNPGNYYVGDLVVDIDPVQDLHGYDSPWPPGGGPNNLFNEASATVYDRYFNSNDIWAYASDSGSYAFPCSPSTTYTLKSNNSDITIFRVGYLTSATLPPDSSTNRQIYGVIRNTDNSAVTITTGSDATYLVIQANKSIISVHNVQLQIEIGTTLDPWSNICPITGWTEATVVRTGANICGGDALNAEIQSHQSRTFSETGRYVSIVASSGGTLVDGFFKENTQYTFMFTIYKTSGTGSNIRVYYTDSTSENIPGVSAAQTKQMRVLVTSAGKTVRNVRVYNSSGTTRLYVDESGIFEGVLTTDDFKPYTGQTYSITFPDAAGTVYGGTLDVTNGVLTVTWAMVDLGSISWNVETAATGKFRTGTLSSVSAFSGKLPKYTGDKICTCYKNAGRHDYTYYADASIWYSNSSADYPGNNIIRLGDSTKANMSAADFKTAVTGQKLCYELNTPVTYQLTPQEVQTLLGQNNLWADTGDIEVEIVERDWEEFLEFSKASLYIDSTSPSNPFEGMIWFDTSLT